jgi:hypothetical protein
LKNAPGGRTIHGKQGVSLPCVLCFLVFVQTSALPTHLCYLCLPRDAHPVTEGCKTKTCCTALCYVDKYGIHHCVHRPGDDFCQCGTSTVDPNADSLLLLAVANLPKPMNLRPDFVASGWISPLPALFEGNNPATPSPPPK